MKPQLFIASTYPQGPILEPRDEPSLCAHTKIVPALDNKLVAYGAALSDRKNDVVFAVAQIRTLTDNGETIYPYMVIGNKDEFFSSLYETADGKRGGHIHEVDNAPFELVEDPIGQKKWASFKSVTIIGSPQFVTWQDSMLAGVQIFSVLETKYIRQIKTRRHEHPQLLADGLRQGIVEWLNDETGLNPVTLPGMRNHPRKVLSGRHLGK